MKNILILVAAGIILFAGGYLYFGQSASKETPTAPAEKSEAVVGGDRDEHGCIASAGYTWCEPKAKCLRNWEEPCASQAEITSEIAGAVKEAIAQKRSVDQQGLTVTVSTVTGGYAAGTAGSGMFFAAYTRDGWQLVWDGNGNIFCTDLEAYPEFPSELIPECYDEDTGSTKTR